jgi:uncharacterized membrane protein YgcG
MDDSIVSVEQDGNDSIQEEPRRKRTRTNLDGKSVTMTDSQVAQLSISLMNQHKAMAGIIPNTMSEETREFFRVQTQMHQEMLKRVQTEKKEDKCAEDPMELREESIEVRDDGKTIVDVKARLMFGKFPNCNPSLWWKPENEIPRLTKPRLRHSLQYSFMSGSFICQDTVYKWHDSGSCLELRHFLSKNSGVRGKTQQKLQVGTSLDAEMFGTLDKDYKHCSNLGEVKEAVRNIQTLTFLIRNYDYGPLALGNALERISWMSGPARGDMSKQKDMVTKFCNRVLAENATRGANMEPPLTYREVIETARITCQDLGRDDSLLFSEFNKNGNSGNSANLNLGGIPERGGSQGGRGGQTSRGGRGGGGRGGGRGGLYGGRQDQGGQFGQRESAER